MRALFPNGRSQRRDRSRRKIRSDNRRKSPCTNRHAQAGPVFGLYPPLHAPEPPAARPKPTCRNTSSLIGSMSEASSLSTFELFTRFDTAHRCKYSFETDFNSSMLVAAQPMIELVSRSTGIRSWTSATKSFGVADYHRARFDAFARFFIFPLVPKTGDRQYRGTISSREVPRLLPVSECPAIRSNRTRASDTACARTVRGRTAS